MPQADGTILIDTEIDADGMKAGSKEIESAIENITKTAKKMSDSISGYNQEAINFIEKYVNKLEGASNSNNEFKKTIEKAKKELSSLEGKGLYFGDEEYDNAFLKLQKVTQALKDYKKELVSPTPNANPFGLDTLSGKIVDAEIELKKLIEAGKGLGDEQYDKVYRNLALLKDEAKQYAKELSKTPAQVQKEAEALAKKEAQQKAAKAKEEARIIELNKKLEETRAKEVQAIMEANRLKAIGDNAEISRKDIVSLNEELEQLKIRQKDLEKAGLGFGFEEFDKNTSRIGQIESQLREYRNSLIKTDEAQKKTSVSGNKVAKSLSNTASAAKKSSFSIGKMLGTSILFSFVFQAINAAMTALTDGFTNLAQYSSSTNNSISMLWSSLERLKNSLATAFAPILDVVAPILSKFIDMLSTAASYVSMFFAFLSGKSTYTRAVAVQKDYAASLEDTADSMKDQAEATEEAADAANGYLGPLDEIERYSDGKNKGSSLPDSPSSGTGSSVSEGPLFEEVPIDSGFASVLDSIIEKLKQIRDIFMDGFWDGLGDYKPLVEELKKDLSSIGSYLTDIFTDADVQSAAQRFAKSFIYNFGKIAGSFASVGLTIAVNIVGGIESFLAENVDRIKNYLVSMFDIGTEIMDTIGNLSATIAEIFSSVFGSQVAQDLTGDIIGIFANTFMGVTELAASLGRDLLNFISQPIIENKDLIKNALLGTLQPLEIVIQSIETFIQDLVDKVLGLYNEHIKPFIDSLASGISQILGILLEGYNQYIVPVLDGLAQKFAELMAGPVGQAINSIISFLGKLIDALKLLWESVLVPFFSWISENVMPLLAIILETVGNNVLSLFAVISNVVSGIFDILSGLIDFLVGVFTGNWELAWQGIQEIFEGVWNLISDFLSSTIDKLNGLISAAESAQNWIADALSFSVDIPWPVSDMVGFDNFTIGVDRISLPRIPYLASGAVIPPNKEFLAVLGDQKNGNNIEAPEGLLRKIFREEAGNQQRPGRVYNFSAQINRRVLFQEMIEEAKMSQTRTGKNPFELA